MENNITEPEKVELVDLIVQVFEHPDAPEWMLDDIWESINDHTSINAYDTDNIRLMFKFMTVGKIRRTK